MRCEAPGCMSPATDRKKFLDPRRSYDVCTDYTVKFFCSPECELKIIFELDRQAGIVHLVSGGEHARVS